MLEIRLQVRIELPLARKQVGDLHDALFAAKRKALRRRNKRREAVPFEFSPIECGAVERGFGQKATVKIYKNFDKSK